MTKCDKCGKEYNGYHIFIPDGFVTFVEIETVREIHGEDLCPVCFNKVMHSESYALTRPGEKQPIGRKKEAEGK